MPPSAEPKRTASHRRVAIGVVRVGGRRRLRLSRALLVVGLSLHAPLAFGDAPSKLSLDSVLASVRRHHPVLEQVQQELLRAEGELLTAKGGFDPTLQASGSYVPYGDYVNGVVDVSLRQPTALWGLTAFGGWRMGKGDFPSYKGDLITAEGGEARAGLELPLLKGGWIDKRRAYLRASRLKQQGARWAVTLARLEVMRRASYAYWAWVGAGRKLAIARALLEIALQRGTAMAERAKHGDLARINQTDNERAIFKRRGGLAKAQRVFEKAAIKLSLYYRDAEQHTVRPALDAVPQALPTTAKPSLAQWREDEAFALSHRPELKDVTIKQQAVAIDRELAANERLPKLNALAVSALDVGSERYRSEWGELKLGLKLEVPLPLRAARGRLISATAEYRRLRAKARYWRDTVVAQVHDAASALRAAHEQAVYAEGERRVAHQLEEAERLQLELGNSTLLIVNLREQDAAEAEQREIDALVRYQQAVADYHAVLGKGT